MENPCPSHYWSFDKISCFPPQVVPSFSMIILPGLTLCYQSPSWFKWSDNQFPCFERSMCQHSWEGMVKPAFLHFPHPYQRFWFSKSSVGLRKFISKVFHMLPLLLGGGPHSEGNCSQLFLLSMPPGCSSFGVLLSKVSIGFLLCLWHDLAVKGIAWNCE